MKLVNHPEARSELREAIGYYNDCRSGLGIEFFNEVRSSFKQIAGSPLLWRYWSENSRRHLIKRFPYTIIYEPRADSVLVVAIAHQSRKPGYWKDRIK